VQEEEGGRDWAREKEAGMLLVLLLAGIAVLSLLVVKLAESAVQVALLLMRC
jgi:hypothetical protein